MVYCLQKKPLFSVMLVIIFTTFLSPHANAYQITPVRHLFDIEHGFLQPSDVAVGKDHRIYILDGVNHQVKVFSETGTFLFYFGGKGSAKGLFKYPLGITTDTQGQVYIADTGNRRVQLFTSHGKFISHFTITSDTKEKPSDPVDVAVDEKRRRLYVVDNDNHHILVYSLDGFSLLGRWGSEGEGRQELRHPFFITVGKDTSVFVVDVLNTRVQVWSPQGEAVSSIGDWGVDLGQLYRPKGVCVDKDNNVYVSDSYLGVIQVFNRYGHFKSVLGIEEGDVMKWKTPVGITIDDRQRLYVVEMLSNRVRVYDIFNKNIQGKE
ncbi:MAG: NHL repeat-containing protein [Deltaproteobacteria bacterium]|nr:NHL repeat-containing protein [Deltaproteobacteria bacterium]